MSLRPHVRGFEIDRLGSIFGSRDEGAIAEAQSRLRTEIVLTPDKLGDERFLAGLRQAVDEGVPFPDLVEESHIHVWVAIALSGVGQDLLCLESDFWSWRSFRAFWEDHAASLDPRGRGIFRCFLTGRPIFGKKFDTDIYYGYLNRSDVNDLKDSLRQRRDDLSGAAASLADDLTGWLDAIDGRGQDLWFHFL